jgi:hypothetical protein
MAKIKVKFYKNNNSKSKNYGKFFGHINPAETLNTRKLAEHIQGHGSIYTLDVIMGVLAAAERCIPELLLQGNKVKLDGLGTFYLTLMSSGETDVTKYGTEQIKGLRIHFCGEQSAFSEWSGPAITRKAQFQLDNYVQVGAKMYRIDRANHQLVEVNAAQETGGDGTGGDGDGDTGSGSEGGADVRP